MTSVSPSITAEQLSSQLRQLSKWLAQCKLLTRYISSSLQSGSEANIRGASQQVAEVWSRLLAALTVTADNALPTVQAQQQLQQRRAQSSDADGDGESSAWRDWEARFATLLQLAESTGDNMQRALALMELGPKRPVQTGLGPADRRFFNVTMSGNAARQRCAIAAAALPGEVTPADEPASSGASATAGPSEAIARQLRRDVQACRRLVDRLQSGVRVAHWTVQYDCDLDSIARENGELDDDDDWET
uniref:Mediator complex subunit 8 n=1 Tax=Macrostomum lignano TaxID=282301 RepID=A0A1I8IT60_9PLAT